jgi:hypothetical protein
MALSIQLRQLARLLGDDAFANESFETGDDLPQERRQRLQAAVEAHLPHIVQGLLEEAVASDDVIDAASADAFLDDRLLFLSDLLTDEQRQAIREGYRRASRRWRQQAR